MKSGQKVIIFVCVITLPDTMAGQRSLTVVLNL